MDFRIPILLVSLSSPDWKTRENATKALQEINPPIMILEICEHDKNLEVARRIKKLANHWYDQNAAQIAVNMRSTKYPRMPMLLNESGGYIYIQHARELYHIPAWDSDTLYRTATMLYVQDLIRCRTQMATIQNMLDNMAADEILYLQTYIRTLPNTVPYSPPELRKDLP